MTEETKPRACPEWCDDLHARDDIQIHDSKALCIPDPSTLVAYTQQVDYHGTRDPAHVTVSVEHGGKHDNGTIKRARLELSPDQARIFGLIVNDAAKAGIKNVRALGKGLTELAALVSDPEADEPEAGA
jgi:hypothetical protein